MKRARKLFFGTFSDDNVTYVYQCNQCVGFQDLDWVQPTA